MKLSTKLTLFVTVSKLAVVLLFVLILPYTVDYVAARYTDGVLGLQKSSVLKRIKENGIDFYLEGQESYGSYTMLHEEFVALEPVADSLKLDTIETAQRIIAPDTLNYRILSYTFKEGGKNYLLEVARSTTVMARYSRPLQTFTFYVLIALIVVTIIIDLLFTHSLIKPLGRIIKDKLINQRFPFGSDHKPIKTTTSDFRYLDDCLAQLMEQVNEAFEKEREFTSNASHELMTPISILQSKMENLMEHPEVSELIQQRLSEQMRTLNRLKKIVSSLMLISRIDNEQFEKTEVVNVKQLFDEVMDEIEHRLQEHQITCKADLDDQRFIKDVNRDLLFQLFYNLINNAIRYNKHQGSIHISDGFENGIYQVVITDTGIGIPTNDIPTIFNRFKKSNNSTTGGYGLGLAIVKSIVNYHHLKIDVASKIDEGTSFTVSFLKSHTNS